MSINATQGHHNETIVAVLILAISFLQYFIYLMLNSFDMTPPLHGPSCAHTDQFIGCPTHGCSRGAIVTPNFFYRNR